MRYWLCEGFAGHFFAVHALAGQYNLGNLNNGINFLGTDFSKLSAKRYSWILGRHWNIEAEIGIGWAYTRYDIFECAGCGKKQAENKAHNYVGPTKAAVSLVYLF